MKIINESMMTNDAERKMEYNNYLKEHIRNVQRSFEQFLLPVLQEDENITPDNIAIIQDQIKQHDKSKYEDVEYEGYLQWFYPVNDDENNKDKNMFNLAWNHHQHSNMHHPQYWLCIRDDGEQIILDMDFASIMEMLSDWHSFSLNDRNSTAYNWYQNHKKTLLISDNTREIIEYYIEYLKEPLD